MQRKILWTLACGAGVLATLSTGIAWGQVADSSGQLQEVVVTAEKRTENLQNVAASVSVVRGDQLAERGVLNAADLSGAIPGVEAQGVNSPAIFVRGVGTSNASITGDAGVAIDLDGVFQPRPTTFAASLLDVDRIEVLEGPQGTLYGRGALGGVVNVISMAPQSEFGGNVELGFGDYSEYRTGAVVNVPLSQNLAMRVAYQKEQHDGYANNGADDADDDAGRVRLQYKATDSIKVGLNVFYAHDGGEGAAYHLYHSYPNEPVPADPWDTTIGGKFQSLDTHTYEVSMPVEADLGFGILTYIPSYIDDENGSTQPYMLSSPSPYAELANVVSHTDGQELRLASHPGKRLEWTVGLYYMDERMGYGLTIPPLVHNFGDFGTTSDSVFGQATYRLTARLHLIAGLRATDESKRQFANDLHHYGHSWSPINGKVGIEYAVAPQSMVYATVANGFKAGGFFTAPGNNFFGPENVTAYELGSKNRVADDTIQLNGSVYLYNYTNYQVNALTQGYNGTFVQGVFNAGTVQVYGTDLESIFELSRTDRLTAAVNYLHGTFKSFSVPVTSGRVGDQIPYSPTFSGNLAYEHSFYVSNGAVLRARAETHFESSGWLSLNHRPATLQGDYTRTNLTLTYVSLSHVSVSIWGHNVEDKAVKTSVTDLLGYETYILSPPRTYGITLTVSF